MYDRIQKLENKSIADWKAKFENDITYRNNLDESEKLYEYKHDKDYIEIIKKQIEEDRLRNHYSKLKQISYDQDDIYNRNQQKKVNTI